MVPVAIDLFCGAGGLSEGFHQAGYKIAYACDFDEQAVATFSFNHPNVLVKQQDINKLTSDQIFSEAKLTRGEVDIVMGGPPCQGFSLAGNRLPDDPKNHLVLEFKRLIKEIRPRIVLMENVPGILSMKGGEVVEILGQEFNDLGYRVAQGVLNAADFGVPQARPRFILIGVTDCGDASLPSPTHQKNGDIAQGNFFSNKPLHSHLTVNEALSDLPRLEQGEGSEVLKHSGIYMNGYQKERRGHRRQGEIYNHRATRHSTTIVQRYSLIPQGFSNSCLPDEIRTKKVNVYRLSESLPSRTVTCNFRTDLLNPWMNRGLTVREAARLQSFDDDYRFFGNLTRKAKWVTQDDQVGNAVPPLLAKALALHIKNILEFGR